MRAVFFGTPAWAVPSLDALSDSSWELAAVVTNPDRPAGRGYETRMSPVKERALELGLPVEQPERAKDPDFAAWLTSLAPDAVVVVAYGKILPASLLAIPRLGFLNVHFSLLPEYRGAAPVQHALLDGKDETGVSIMVLTEGMDEGPVLARAATPIEPGETAGALGARLAAIGADLLVATLGAYAAGEVSPEPQDDALATYAPKLSVDQTRIDWSASAERIVDQARALNPAPGAWSTFRGARVKLHAVARTDREGLAPGEVLFEDDGWFVGTGSGAVEIREAQLAGKKRMSGAAAARGLRIEPGECFG